MDLMVVVVLIVSKKLCHETVTRGQTMQALTLLLETTNGTKHQLNPKYNTNKDAYISINNELKPALVRVYENETSPNASPSAKCINIFGCPSYGKSFSALGSVNSMIGNVSSNTGILILEGANDSQTPIEQALLLQQRLTEVNHPDHLIIVYPGLGHTFVPSSQWVTSNGQIEEYVLADFYTWLEAHSGLSHPFANTAATSHTTANITSSSSSSSK